jgi:hypothetical protein
MRLVALKEIAQAGLQMRLQRRALAAHGVALLLIETGKAQSVAKAACLRPLCLICWLVLRQSRPHRNVSGAKARRNSDNPV